MSTEAVKNYAECYAVIFSNQRSNVGDGYEETAHEMQVLAATMPGYIGHESARNEDGFGITVSYWESEEAIAHWKRQLKHLSAQERGKKEWYKDYIVRVAKVVRSYGMKRTQGDKRHGGS